MKDISDNNNNNINNNSFNKNQNNFISYNNTEINNIITINNNRNESIENDEEDENEIKKEILFHNNTAKEVPPVYNFSENFKLNNIHINEFNLDESAYDNIYNLFSEKRRKFSIDSEYTIREVYLPENKSIKEWCNKPIYKIEFYENLINYKLMLEYFNSNENLIKIKKSSNLIEKWSKIIENKNYFKYEQFKTLIDELIKIKNLFINKSILEYIHDIFIRIGYETAKIKRIFQNEDFNLGNL